MLTQFLGWLGVGLTTFASVPQLKNVKQVNRTTYELLIVGIICLLIRAVAIREWVFIIGEALSLLLVYLVWRQLT